MIAATLQNDRAVRLDQCLELKGERLAGLMVSGLQLDSRRLRAGEAFIALPGEQQDGRNYFADAQAAGAAVIIAESGVTELQRAAAMATPVLELQGLAGQLGMIASRFYGAPSAAMHLVAVTGTNGKTTTSRVLAQLLRGGFGCCGVIGTLGATLDNAVDDALNTTPDAISLQGQLAAWAAAGVAHSVLEVSSHSLVQGRVGGLQINTAIFTNLSHDHLDYHGTMDRYGQAKAMLFQHPGLENAVINLDDPFAAQLQAAVTGLRQVGYSSAGRPAPVAVSDIRYRDHGLEAGLLSPWGEGVLHSPLPGDFNLSNLLAAVSAACLAGMSLDAVLAATTGLEAVPGRMQYVANNRGLQLVVDYAHTPEALRQALLALRRHVAGELICVFGCGGERDADKRPLMGAVAARHADRVVVTSDNPRREPPLAIINDILAGIEGAAEVEADRAAAIACAVSGASPGDAVLVAGKGHESYQQVGDERLPFSDVAHIERILRAGGAV